MKHLKEHLDLEGGYYEIFSAVCCFKCAKRKDGDSNDARSYEQPTSLKNLMVAEQKAGKKKNYLMKMVRLAKNEKFEERLAKQECLFGSIYCKRE